MEYKQKQMIKHMKKLIAILSFFTILAVFFSIETKGKEDIWNSKGGRSISLFVSMEENELHIYSDNQWDNVSIQMLDANGIVFYLDHTTVGGGEATVIPLPDLPKGNYQVILTRNNQPISWYLTK